MGSIVISGGRFLESLSEIAGFKCGLALGRDDLMKIFAADERLQSFLGIEDQRVMRLNSVKRLRVGRALTLRLNSSPLVESHLLSGPEPCSTSHWPIA